MLSLGLGQVHRQHWAPTRCLQHSLFKTVPSWLLFLQVFALIGDLPQYAFILQLHRQPTQPDLVGRRQDGDSFMILKR